MMPEDQHTIVPDPCSTDDNALTFTCPRCGGNKLFLRQEALLEVQAVYSSGDVDFDGVYPDEDLGYECRGCQYVLQDKDGDPVCGRDLTDLLDR